jgi:hypothetical protein
VWSGKTRTSVLTLDMICASYAVVQFLSYSITSEVGSEINGISTPQQNKKKEGYSTTKEARCKSFDAQKTW